MPIRYAIAATPPHCRCRHYSRHVIADAYAAITPLSLLTMEARHYAIIYYVID